MALAPYQRQERSPDGIEIVNYDMPQVADAGRPFRALSQSLLQQADPIMRDRAEKQAKTDAGRAPLVRDEQGNLVRAEPLPGGGLVYRDTFMRVANHVYKGRLEVDADLKFQEIRRNNIDTPQTALAQMQAHIEAVMKTVPDDIRAEIEGDLLKEAAQQFNGLAWAKTVRDREVLSKDLDNEATQLLQSATKDTVTLLQSATTVDDFAAASAQLGEKLKKLNDNQQRRLDMGLLTPKGMETEDMGIDTALASVQVEMQSVAGMRDFLLRAKEWGSDEATLEVLSSWVNGDISGGKRTVLGMNFDQFVDMIPSERARGAIAAQANAMLSDMRAARSAADQAAAQARLNATLEKAINAFAGEGAYGAGNTTAVQKALDEQTLQTLKQHQPNVTQWLLYGDGQDKRAGINHAMSIVSQHGYLPTQYRNFILDNIDGTNGMVAADMMMNLTMLRGPQQQAAGLKVLRSMPPAARAKADFIIKMREGGMDQGSIITLLEKKNLQQIPSTRGAVAAYFRDDDDKPSGKLYMETRDRLIKDVVGETNGVYRDKVAYDTDKLVGAYLALYGEGRQEEALRAAINGVVSTWRPHPWGLNGYVPAELASMNLQGQELDLITGLYVKGEGFRYSGASFARLDSKGRPRARLELADDDSTIAAGLGHYRVYAYDAQGNPVGSPITINLDAAVKRLARFKNMTPATVDANVAAARAQREKERQQFQRRKRDQRTIRGVGRD